MNAQRPGERSSHRDTHPSIVTVASMETIADVQDRHVAILASHPQLTITRVRIGPGVRVSALHVHHTHTDAFYVLEGEVTFELGPDAQQLVLGAGGFLAVPPGVAHAFLNTSDAAARLLNFHAPDGGFAGFLRGVRDGAPVTWDIHDVADDGGLDPDQALVLVAGSGERLTHANRVAVVKSDLPDLFLAELTVDGDLLVPDLHENDAEVDSLYVLDGRLTVAANGEERGVGPGELAFAPPGVILTFSHREAGVARFLNIRASEAGSPAPCAEVRARD